MFRIALRSDYAHEGSRHELAATLWQCGFREAAVQEYRSLVRMHPRKVTYLYELGYVLRNVDRAAEAILVLGDALALELRAEIYVELARCYDAVGRSDDEAAALQRAMRISPSNHEVLLQHIRHLAENRRWPEAIDAGLLLLAKAPSAEVAYIAGVGLAQAGRTAEAEQVLLRGLAVEPENVDLQAELGVVWADMGKATHAKKRLEKAVLRNAKDSHLRVALSYVLLSCEEPTAALEAAISAVQLESDVPETHCALGYAHLALDQPDQALMAFEKADALAPGTSQVQAGVAASLSSLKRYDESLSVFHALLEADPEYFSKPAGAYIKQFYDEAVRLSHKDSWRSPD